jgi:hypothetical protein
MHNRVFFPQTALDVWLSDGTVDLSADELTIVAAGGQAGQSPEPSGADRSAPGRRDRLTEAVHIVNEVTGTPDANGLLGRVKSKAFLADQKAELLESSLLLGDNAYDVVPGWLGEPIGTFADYAASQTSARAVSTDEELLTAYLLKT